MDPANGVKASFGYPSQTNCRTEEEGDDDCDREDPNPVGGPSDQSITSLGTGAPDSSVHHAPTSPVLIVLGTASKRRRLAQGGSPGQVMRITPTSAKKRNRPTGWIPTTSAWFR